MQRSDGSVTPLRLLLQMKVEDGLAQREIHARMQAQQAEQVRLALCNVTGPNLEALLTWAPSFC